MPAVPSPGWGSHSLKGIILVADLFKRFLNPKPPQIGEIWWVKDADLGIKTTADAHPVVIVGGPSFEGGPVRIAPGSSSLRPTDGEVALLVGPGDCIPAGAVTKHTRFRMNEMRRLPAAVLAGRIGTLTPAKLEELRTLRATKIL